VTPSFKVTPDLMVYARVATGYRAGGSNGVEEEAGIPETYNPDITTNYEIGAKGDFLDHTLTVDGSIYYIDWKDIQIGLLSPDNVGYTGNAGAAKSQGLEMSVESRPFDGLRLAGWVAFNDAVLTAYPAAAVAAGTYAYPGDRLPYTSRFSSHVSVDEEFPLATNLTGFVGGSVSYLSGRWDRFAPVDVPRNYLPAYARTDLHAGVDYESWKVNFYANNVMNRLGLLQGQLNMPVSGAWYIPPRTIGISVARNF
jgi:outer membrane receptor protein involved in Fe transport